MKTSLVTLVMVLGLTASGFGASAEAELKKILVTNPAKLFGFKD